MCEPTTIALASLAVGAAAAGAQYKAQSDQASSASKYQNSRYRSVSAAAQENYKRAVNTTITREAEEVAAASGQAVSANIAAAKGRGSAVASAGARGVGGATVDELFAEYDAIGGMNQAAVQTNLGWRLRQINESRAGLQADANGQITSATPLPISTPSLLGLGLNLGSSALNAGTTYLQLTQPRV